MSEHPFSVVPLRQQDRSGFTCGNEALNAYLLTQAGQDMKRRVAACFVAIDSATGAVAGFLPVEVSAAVTPAPAPTAVEIVLVNGRRLRGIEGLSPTGLAQLIRVVESA